MPVLIDTSVAIHLRDATAGVGDRIAELQTQAFLSVVSLVELEGGIAAVPSISALRRAKLDILLQNFDLIDFTHSMAEQYGTIVTQNGFSRSRIIDRMIAATALVHGLTLITTNGPDFSKIDGLNLLVWDA